MWWQVFLEIQQHTSKVITQKRSYNIIVKSSQVLCSFWWADWPPRSRRTRSRWWSPRCGSPSCDRWPSRASSARRSSHSPCPLWTACSSRTCTRRRSHSQLQDSKLNCPNLYILNCCILFWVCLNNVLRLTSSWSKRVMSRRTSSSVRSLLRSLWEIEKQLKNKWCLKIESIQALTQSPQLHSALFMDICRLSKKPRLNKHMVWKTRKHTLHSRLFSSQMFSQNEQRNSLPISAWQNPKQIEKYSIIQLIARIVITMCSLVTLSSSALVGIDGMKWLWLASLRKRVRFDLPFAATQTHFV